MENDMALPYEHYIGNIITRSLTYVEIPDDTTDSINVYLVTRNQHVLDHFGIFDFPFKEFDPSTKQIQAVDVLTGKTVVIHLTNSQKVSIPGDPNLLSPPSVGNPLFYEIINERDIADMQLPFCITIKNLKENGYFYENIITNVRKDIVGKILRFCDITKILNFEIAPEMHFFMHDYIHMMCNKKLHMYISDEKYELLTMRYIINSATEEIKDVPLDTFENIKDFLNDVEKVITVWGSFIQRLIDEQITTYNNEYETVISELINTSDPREKEFIRLQYNKAISDLKSIDIDGNLRKFGANTRLILRYLPSDIKIPEKLYNVRIFSSYENAIITALIKNGINISEKDIEFDYINTIMGSNGIDDIMVQLNAYYLDQIKEVRMQQIIRCANEIVEVIKQESLELDEEDLQDIISSMQDFDSFKERIEEYSDISSVLQYWPSVLLPAPQYVTRLAGTTHNFINVQMSS